MTLLVRPLVTLVIVLTTAKILHAGTIGAVSSCSDGDTVRGFEDFKAVPRQGTIKDKFWTFTGRGPNDRARADLRLNDRKPFTPASLNLTLTNVGQLVIRFIFNNHKNKNLVYKNPNEEFSLPLADLPEGVVRTVILATPLLGSTAAFKIDTLQGCVRAETIVITTTTTTAPSVAPTSDGPPASAATAITGPPATAASTTAGPPTTAAAKVAGPSATAASTIAGPPATAAATVAGPPATAASTIAGPPATAATTVAGPPATAATTVAGPPATAATTVAIATAPVSACGASKELDRLNGVTGGQSRRRRVVGGTRTGQCNVIPWQVRLTTSVGEMCGGSILDAGHILTAAHCIPYRGTTINITAGDYNTGIIEGNEQTRVVSLTNVTTHPKYYTNRYGAEYNDIAVVRLSEPLDMTKPCVMPVCLDKDFVVSGQNCTISGWGAPSESAKEASTLQFANVVAYRGENCTEAFKIPYSSYMSSPDTQLCAGRVAGGVGMCDGDYGGPLVCRDDTINAYVLTGIYSYDSGCGRVNFLPGIYTDISAFYDWIQEQLKVN
ncbi:serine proteinase stubble-like [Littorina saxatilis]|uniref:Peptidase S1 domain-containing protein n=1 Tax=Littorina saxatilis TaxID=31220 RepID=A0AAN9C0A7_9CAEN